MENEEHHPETFAQILARLKDEYGVSDTEIARRTGLHVSTVNTWVHGKRTPRPAAVRALAEAFPKFPLDALAAAAQQSVPPPLEPDSKQRLLDLFEKLTEEQRELQEIQIQAVVRRNQQGAS
ncbi:helix-turn-helix transcriptional regulator [Streptomyces tremellae]|uniref:HTH cro/C1-type domain-containing protein n=1 Tax=Streptomyces tremellae TaxID=1124239 RepID=A0ABP7EFE1_9ACTN